jgi:hypothetical protein
MKSLKLAAIAVTVFVSMWALPAYTQNGTAVPAVPNPPPATSSQGQAGDNQNSPPAQTSPGQTGNDQAGQSGSTNSSPA